jgi:nitroimidazol reductase NimA-like FMN-containing flavoprotein (pyridoxamine 5'-phosphate oxidase superfamily)
VYRYDETPVKRLATLSNPQCARLLESNSVGRVAWQAADGQQILPVTYVYRSDLVYFRTVPYGILSELVRPTDVAFEVDDIDQDTRTGWSVVLSGQARAVAAPAEMSELLATDDLVPWAPGIRTLVIQIKTSRIRGREIRRP